MAGFRYKAFISYSHTDEHWARWLQHALESYRIPKVLVGKRTGYGEIPARLGTVFRDREDLSSATSLTETVQHELSSAETLVVICSPAAAQSPWVKEEIKAYKALGRANRIYALIVDGDPQSLDPAVQCFPIALLTADDGTTQEPLAADIRKWADGKGLAKLKLVAGILGIRLDELRRREMLRRRRRLTTMAAGVSAIVILTTFLSLTAISNRKEADQRRANTEDLVSFMLGKLEDLSPVAGLDVLDDDQVEMIRLSEQFGFQKLDDGILLDKALEWREEGITARYKRDNEAAMTAFNRSLAALVNLYLRDKENMDHLFELGQAEFWAGYAHLDNGDFDQAEKMMTYYGVIARRLINADPKSAVNVMELSYTLTNLGAIETMRASGDEDRAIYLAQAALEYNQLALVLEPDNQDNMTTMAGSHAWLADSWLGICNLYKANQSRLKGVAVVKQMLEQNSDDPELLIDLSHGLGGLAYVQARLGVSDLAEENLSASASLLGKVAGQENNKNGYAWDQQVRLGSLGQMMVDTGRINEGRKLISESTRLMAEQYNSGSNPSFDKKLEVAISLGHQSSLAIAMENIVEARKLNREAIQILSEIVSQSPDSSSGQYRLAHALVRYWQLHEKLPPSEWQGKVKDYSLSDRQVRSCDLADLAVRQAVMRGDWVSAKSRHDYLFDKDYREPGYIRFCEAYGLCK